MSMGHTWPYSMLAVAVPKRAERMGSDVSQRPRAKGKIPGVRKRLMYSLESWQTCTNLRQGLGTWVRKILSVCLNALSMQEPQQEQPLTTLGFPR